MVTKSLTGRLLAWYGERQRDLPWRRLDGAYPTWVSEIMLQQTRVETVIPYFQRFLERFPTVADLAAAPEDEVLRHWAGLGYYRRARMLHRAAGVVCEDLGGAMPTNAADWKALPGIGDYTSAAIASIAHGEAVPVVDGNVKRVAARLLALEHAADATALHKAAAEWGGQLMADLPADAAPGDLNQALMELGATVCTPRAPRCDECPVADSCAARAAGDPEQWPRPGKKTQWVDLPLAYFLARGPEQVLLLPRAEGWNPGLYEPPSLPDVPDGELDAAWRATGCPESLGKQIGAVRHTITHHRIRARVFELERWDGRDAHDPATVPLTAIAKKILAC